MLKRSVILSLPIIFAVGFFSLWMTLLWPTTAAQADIPTILIDDFSVGQPSLALTHPADTGTSTSSTVSGAGILGGERDIEITLTTSAIGGNGVSAGVAGGSYSYSQDPTVAASGSIVWDGADGNAAALDPTGLGGLDLTSGGQQNALLLDIIFDDNPIDLAITIYTDGANSSTFNLSLAGGIFSPIQQVLPFSAFSTSGGVGADFTNVGAIVMTVTSATAPDFVLDSLRTTNSLNATLTDVLLLDDGNSLVDPGDTIRYTAVIQNPDDAANAAETGVTFAAIPDANTTLVIGSVTTSQGTVITGNTAGDTDIAIDIGTLADGVSTTITFDVLVNTPFPQGVTELSVQGFVNSDSLTNLPTDDTDDPTGNDDATVTAVNPPPPPLQVSKTAAPEPAVAGTSMTYTVNITNTTLTTITNIVLSDTLPASTTLSFVDHIDDDNNPLGFGGGIGDNIIWIDPRPDIDTDNERLTISDTLAMSGIFTSRVMDANSSLPWETLSWVPRRPYGKALPDNGAAESAYDVGNVDMLGNRVLLHLDQGTAVFSNTSGIGQNAVCPAVSGESCPFINPTGGLFSGYAIFDGISDTIAISETSNPGRYAIELWVAAAITDNTSLILQTDSYSTTVFTYSQMIGINDGFFVHRVLDDSGQLKTVTSTTPVTPFEIYHLVGVAESNGDLKLFVNGVEEARRSDVGTIWQNGTHYRLGSAYEISGTTYFEGDMEEVAIYNRTLSSGEIFDRYIRGVNQLKFQVRSCDYAVCDTEPFVGPDGTPLTSFSEAQNVSLGLPTAVLSGVVADNRYFQYQANFFTANPAVAPELQAVTVAPGHPAIESSQGSCTAVMGTFTCTIGSLASNATATITLQVNIHPSALGVITNTVFVTSTEGFSNTAAVTSTIVSEADLQLVKHDVEDPVSIGSPLTYTIDVINAGPSTVLSATVTDTLPLSMTGTAAGLGWNCTAGNTMTCTIASLLPGTYLDAIVITTTSPITEGVITNTAGITSSLTPETVITNNVVYENTTVVRLANLAIAKEDSPDPVLPGATLTYTITVQNNGPYTATNVIVTDTLPSGLTANLVSTAGWLCAPQIGDTLVCGLTSLSPSEVASYTITATAPVSGFLINTAVVSSDILDPDLEDNEAAAFTAIERVSDLSIHKTDAVDPVLAGETITYTVVVTNEGPVAAGVLTTTIERGNGGDINVPILAGEASRYPSAIFFDSVPGLIRNITVTLENVSHTFPQDLSILLVGPTGQSVILMSEAAGGQDADNVTLTFNDSGTPVPTNGLLTDTLVYRPSNYGLSTPFPTPAPAGPYGGSLSAFNNSSPNGQWQLYIIDTVDSDGGAIGGWRLEITAATTDTVTMAEFLPTTSTPSMTSAPAGWQFDPLTTHEWQYVTNQLAVGQPVSFTIEVTAPITPGVITNTAVITTTGLDLITGNNTAVITTTVLPLVDLVITKTAAALTAPIGYPIVYTLTVGNNGPSPAIAPITLTDSLPPALTSVAVITNGWSCDTNNLPELSCTIDSLGVGLAPELVVMAQLPVTKGMLTNMAVVTSTLAETDTGNNEAAVTITVSDIPIQGLVASNSSPHVLNVETLLQASIVTGTNVSYVWNLGDGTIISGNPISHTYPTTGTFTAVVTASNDVSVMTASTLVMIDEYNTLYLPVIGHQFVEAPDLEVISLTVSSNNVTIVIANNGWEEAADEFWVDFYVNPFIVPVGPNDIWQNSGGSGAVWGIEGSAIPLAPGETLTLTLNDAYYRPEFSSLTFPITAGSQTYAHVDSANANTNSGAVLENHELLGLPYNNILGPVTSTADVQPSTAVPTDRPPLSNKLPPRPQ